MMGGDHLTSLPVLRALDGVNIVVADLVEVARPFDPSGTTAWIGASVPFETLCVTATATAQAQGRAPVTCNAIPEARS